MTIDSNSGISEAVIAKVLALAVIGRLPDEWQSQVETT